MADKESSDQNNRKIRQPISVPFIWEEIPGTPKRDWKPSAPPINSVAPPPQPQPPVKLVASIPFQWEEKPGKPLPFFSRPPPEFPLAPPPAKIINFPSPLLYSQRSDDNCNGSCSDDDDGEEEQFEKFESETEACGFETDRSYSSAPSLLANCLVPTEAIFNAVPVQQTSLMESNSGQLQTPLSPASETDSSTSSYATGTTSLVGTSFLERLFPLLSPKSDFHEKVGCSDKVSSHNPPDLPSTYFDRESNSSLVIRKPSTLGELIMLSRRRSYLRKVAQRQKQNLSMEFIKKSALGCCVFGTRNSFRGFHGKWRQQLQLKLI